MDSAYLAQRFGQDLPDISADMRVSCFMTGTDKAKANIISFDTDGIPFILDSGADCIVSNVRELFEDLQVVTCSIALPLTSLRRRQANALCWSLHTTTSR
eukprot:scaffold3297_cov143-Skeletonema_dohrnii-CCMP3373.AAC.1